MTRALLAAGCATVMLVAANGCRRREASPPAAPDAAAAPVVGRVVQLRFADRSAPEMAALLDDAALREHAVGTFRRAGVLPLELDAEARRGVDWRLDLELAFERLEQGDRGVLRALVGARLARIGGHDAPIAAQAAAERAYQKKDLAATTPAEAARAHLERALTDVLGLLANQARYHVGDVKDLVAGLAEGDPDLRAEAVRAAGARREKSAVAPLCEVIKSDDARMRDLALGALVEIGDPAAVPVLTRMARFRDTRELPKLLDAVAALGGDEAVSFLEFVAASHEDADMRSLAHEARERMKRRR